MKPNLLLLVSAIYLALVGIGLLLAPDALLFGALGAAAPAIVVGAVRGYGAALIGIAAVNGAARNAAASPARDAIFLGGTVGYALVTITQAIAVLGGAPQVAWLFVLVDGLFAVAFFFVGRASMSTGSNKAK